MKPFTFCWERLIKRLLLQSFLQKFKPSKFLILGRNNLHTFPGFFLKFDHNHRICYNICVPFWMSLAFFIFNFNTFLSLTGSLLTFVPFTSLLIFSFHVFLDISLGKLPIILKVLHLLSNKTFSPYISLTKDSQSGGLSISGLPIRVNPSRNPIGSYFLILFLWKFELRISGRIKVWDTIWRLQHWFFRVRLG